MFWYPHLILQLPGVIGAHGRAATQPVEMEPRSELEIVWILISTVCHVKENYQWNQNHAMMDNVVSSGGGERASSIYATVKGKLEPTHLPQVFTSVHLLKKVLWSRVTISSPCFHNNNWVNIYGPEKNG